MLIAVIRRCKKRKICKGHRGFYKRVTYVFVTVLWIILGTNHHNYLRYTAWSIHLNITKFYKQDRVREPSILILLAWKTLWFEYLWNTKCIRQRSVYKNCKLNCKMLRTPAVSSQPPPAHVLIRYLFFIFHHDQILLSLNMFVFQVWIGILGFNSAFFKTGSCRNLVSFVWRSREIIKGSKQYYNS